MAILMTQPNLSVAKDLNNIPATKMKNLDYFDKKSSQVDDNVFGTSMSVTPIYRPFLDNEIRMKINPHMKKKLVIGSNIKSINLGGTQILNWADSKMESILHRELMMVESLF